MKPAVDIRLEYSLHPSELRAIVEADLESVSAIDLEYRLFCGDILFRVDEAIFDAEWNWIPVVGFAVALIDCLQSLEQVGSGRVGFTESAAELRLQRQGQLLGIEASYTSDRATVPYLALRSATCAFCEKMVTELAGKWPRLLESGDFRDISEKLGGHSKVYPLRPKAEGLSSEVPLWLKSSAGDD